MANTPGKRAHVSEASKAAAKAAANRPRIATIPGKNSHEGVKGYSPERLALIEAKKQLAMGLSTKGVPHILRIIEDGPGVTSEENQLWTYAMTFAADRAGLPRVAQVDIDPSDMPEIVVRMPNFPRPADA